MRLMIRALAGAAAAVLLFAACGDDDDVSTDVDTDAAIANMVAAGMDEATATCIVDAVGGEFAARYGNFAESDALADVSGSDEETFTNALGECTGLADLTEESDEPFGFDEDDDIPADEFEGDDESEGRDAEFKPEEESIEDCGDFCEEGPPEHGGEGDEVTPEDCGDFCDGGPPEHGSEGE